ncbi:hypothetical protein QZH41_019870 [Actinostola sp. cb2023]|nr:hypothetical protein QZH41_019870 [Actinostola sp. cb2023]
MRRPSFTRSVSTDSVGRVTPVPTICNDDQTTTTEDVPKIWGSTRKKLTVVCLAVVYFATCAAFSVLSPFFPNEAKGKGASGTIVGLIFGVYSLVSFIVSPIFGVMLPKVGSRFAISSGLLLMGGAELLFGFVDLMPSGAVYIVFCFILRIVSAVGGAMSDVAIFAIVAGEFPTNLGAVMVKLINLYPRYHGDVFRVGFHGRTTTRRSSVYYTNPEEQETGSLLQTLRIPAISVLDHWCIYLSTGSCIVLSGVVLGFLDPTLSPHLTEYGLSPSKIGLMFLLMGAVYAISAPFVGWIGDKTGRTRILIIIGILFSVVGYMILGPSPLLRFLPEK